MSPGPYHEISGSWRHGFLLTAWTLAVGGFAEDLKRAGSGLKEPTVVIDADASATHQSVIHVMEAARLAGYTQVTFTTQALQK